MKLKMKRIKEDLRSLGTWLLIAGGTVCMTVGGFWYFEYILGFPGYYFVLVWFLYWIYLWRKEIFGRWVGFDESRRRKQRKEDI